MSTAEKQGFVDRLRRAVDAHDLEALVDCFGVDYRNETPAHPGRGFTGREQVRANWQRIFIGVPDVTAEVLRTAVDGARHLMRGVIIFGVADGRAAWARFYLEPADPREGGVDAAVSTLLED